MRDLERLRNGNQQQNFHKHHLTRHRGSNQHTRMTIPRNLLPMPTNGMDTLLLAVSTTLSKNPVYLQVIHLSPCLLPLPNPFYLLPLLCSTLALHSTPLTTATVNQFDQYLTRRIPPTIHLRAAAQARDMEVPLSAIHL